MLQVCLLCNIAPFKVWISILPRQDLKIIPALLTYWRRNIKLNMIVWNLDYISVLQGLQYWQTKVKRSFVVEITHWHFNNIDSSTVNAVLGALWNKCVSVGKILWKCKLILILWSLIPYSIRSLIVALGGIGTELKMVSIFEEPGILIPIWIHTVTIVLQYCSATNPGSDIPFFYSLLPQSQLEQNLYMRIRKASDSSLIFLLQGLGLLNVLWHTLSHGINHLVETIWRLNF